MATRRGGAGRVRGTHAPAPGWRSKPSSDTASARVALLLLASNLTASSFPPSVWALAVGVWQAAIDATSHSQGVPPSRRRGAAMCPPGQNESLPCTTMPVPLLLHMCPASSLSCSPAPLRGCSSPADLRRPAPLEARASQKGTFHCIIAGRHVTSLLHGLGAYLIFPEEAGHAYTLCISIFPYATAPPWLHSWAGASAACFSRRSIARREFWHPAHGMHATAHLGSDPCLL